MRRFVWAGLACVALSACAKSTSGGSSETHFLASCSADSCGEGLSCVCGICTEACDDDGACEELSGEASCQIAAGDSCTTARVCDVECDSDDDCGELGSDHECDDGRCRAPRILGPGNMQPAPTGLVECTPAGVASYLVGAEIDDCLSNADMSAPPTTIPTCLQARERDSAPFYVAWTEPGEDSRIERAILGLIDGTRDYQLYELYYDSFGFVDDSGQAWTTRWTRIEDVSVAESCEEPRGCFRGYTTVPNSTCGCGTDPEDGELFVECKTPLVQECEAPSCLIDGICYPNGESSEDGCCSCEDGSYTCIEPGWCPSWPLIGKRCDSDADCTQGASSGLRCQASISGERNICTRDCNFGCPTGTECVETDDFSGELCMRSCTTDANCNIDVFSESLGSECAAVGEGGMYCR